MGGWLVSERRGPPWKKGWVERCISAVGLPPLPLLPVFAILFFYLHLSHSYQNPLFCFKLFLYLLPLILIFIARYSSSNSNVVTENNSIQTEKERERGARSSPWRVALLLLLLLLLISYHPSLKSKWFRNASSSH